MRDSKTLKKRYEKIVKAGYTSKEANKIKYWSEQNIKDAISYKREILKEEAKNYKSLIKTGFSETQAESLKKLSHNEVTKTIKEKAISMLEKGERISRPLISRMATAIGFSSKEADRIKNLNTENLKDVFKTGQLKEAGKYVLEKTKDNIKYKSALESDILLAKTNIFRKNMYIYKVEYRITSDVEFFRDKKYVSVYSRKKLTQKEVFDDVVNNIFPKHDEEYGVTPDPTTLKIVDAYYMTPQDYDKLVVKRENSKNGR